MSAMELRKYDAVSQHPKPELVSVDTGDYKARALVTNYVRRGVRCTLWVFVPFLQNVNMSKYIYVLEDDIIAMAADICEVIKCIDEKDFIPGNRGKGSLDRRIQNKVEKIISYLYFGSYDTMYQINRCMEYLAGATEESFIKFGYDIRYNFVVERDKCLHFVDMKSFTLFYFHLMAFFSECGVDKSINADFRVVDEKLKIKITLTMPYPPFYAARETDIMRLADLCPKNAIDVMVFKRICETYKYDFRFTINDEGVNNVEVFFDVPLKVRMMVFDSERSDQMEVLLLKGDIAISYINMLRSRVFSPEGISLN